MTIRYHDLEIELDRNCSGEPEIRILRSTFDRPRAPFVFEQEDRKRIEAKVQEFDELLLKTGSENRRRALAEDIGVELHQVLLPGEIGRTCERCLDALRDKEGLRLRLSFGRDYDHALGSLPWELACHPQTRRFISNDARFSVARYLDLGEHIQPLDVEPPLKILAVIASPDPATSKEFKYSRIGKETHRQALDEAIGRATYLQVRFLHEVVEGERTTLTAMRKELKDAEFAGSPYHAVHILCHGGFKNAEGVLLFERPDGSEHLVTARELGRMMTPDVRLVVLASCNTGKIPIPRIGGRHPFSGVASALVAAGKPAVLAMQFTVSEAAAIAFSEALYRMVDENRPIDAAVTEGRLAIESAGSEGALEWATPVLFLRAFDGKVLNLRQVGAPAKTVAVFNVLDHGKDKMQQADFRVDLRRYFDDRFIKHRDDWNGAVMNNLRRTLKTQAPRRNPLHIELAAPLSVAFASGFLLPAKDRRKITLGQHADVWDFTEVAVSVPSWLDEEKTQIRAPDDFPFTQGATDIAVVVEAARPAIGAVADYLRRQDLAPPSIGRLLYARFEQHDHFTVLGGGHARGLAATLIQWADDAARKLSYPTVHFFLAGPNGLAFALGREAHVLEQIQLYEFDFEKKRHKSYEPSITLVPSMSES